MECNFRALAVICLLLQVAIACTGEVIPKEQHLRKNINFLKLAFGVNLDFLDSIHERNEKISKYSPSLRDPSTTSPFHSSCVGLFGAYCLDCRTFMVCQDAEKALYNSSCPAATPYCFNGGCQAEPSSSTCLDTVATFKCNAAGYFPDPVSCAKFHHCSKVSADWKVTSYTCPTGFTYNSATNNCLKTISPATCKPFTCKPNQIVRYNFNAGYYGVCAGDTPTPTMPVLKCPDTKNMVFNLATYGCDFNCKAEGYFADLLAPNKYYFCYRVNLVYNYLHESCPDNYLFREGQCQEKTTTDLALDVLLKSGTEEAVIPDSGAGDGAGAGAGAGAGTDDD